MFEPSASPRLARNSINLRPAILAIGTALPPYQIDQRTFGDWMAASFAERPAVARLVQSLHSLSGIETRYSCIPDYSLPVAESRYAPGPNKHRVRRPVKGWRSMDGKRSLWGPRQHAAP